MRNITKVFLVLGLAPMLVVSAFANFTPKAKAVGQKRPTLLKATVDLNGDGTKEQVNLSLGKDKSNFVLTVGKCKVKSRMPYDIDGFQLVDIDVKDKSKEIAVYTSGPSDDFEYWIYSYDGKSVKLMGKLKRWPDFAGHGLVSVRDHVDFWQKTDTYKLDNQKRALVRVPKELYTVNVPTVSTGTVSLNQSKDLRGKTVSCFKKGDKVTVATFYARNNGHTGSYYVKNAQGKGGWISSAKIYTTFPSLPVAD